MALTRLEASGSAVSGGTVEALAQGEEPETPGDEPSDGCIAVTGRPVKITFGELREIGLRGVLIYCADYRCSHSVAINAEQWDEVDDAAN